jgi:transcriptional regulator with XRE-family HTH domain
MKTEKKCNFTVKELQDMFFDTEKIKKEVKKARQLLGITQTDMARVMGMTQGGYGKLESGKTKMTIDQLDKICEHLGIGIADILVKQVDEVKEKEEKYGEWLIDGMEKAVKTIQDEIKKMKKKKS